MMMMGQSADTTLRRYFISLKIDSALNYCRLICQGNRGAIIVVNKMKSLYFFCKLWQSISKIVVTVLYVV